MDDRLGYLVSEPFDRVFYRRRQSTQVNGATLLTDPEIRDLEPLSFPSTEKFSIVEEDKLVEDMTIPDEADDTTVESSSTLIPAHRTTEAEEERFVVRFRCWVVYSDSYRVPQLLFNGSTTGERILSSLFSFSQISTDGFLHLWWTWLRARDRWNATYIRRDHRNGSLHPSNLFTTRHPSIQWLSIQHTQTIRRSSWRISKQHSALSLHHPNRAPLHSHPGLVYSPLQYTNNTRWDA